ncbi:MAG: GDSL-family lipase/acylhydrolase [Herbinix sp.]|nr:GDSL-family lipase/acylhydrolase [Herbinix sp.]
MGDSIQDSDKDAGGNNSKNNSQSGAKDTGSSNDITESDVGGTGKTKGDNQTDRADEAGQFSSEFVAVEDSYFDDALFIGDSRTVGLADYSGWKNTTFYADVGLTIYDIFDKQIVEVDKKKMTIENALQKKSFQKIYIMLGINEMGTGNAESFTKAYKGVIERIEELQPNAIIFVEAIMNVTKEKSDTDPIFNNTNIEDRNNHLATLADDKKIFYIDVNEAITDSTGAIPAEYTFDNIHLKAAYYKLWTDFLLKNGIINK